MLLLRGRRWSHQSGRPEELDLCKTPERVQLSQGSEQDQDLVQNSRTTHQLTKRGLRKCSKLFTGITVDSSLNMCGEMFVKVENFYLVPYFGVLVAYQYMY